MGRPPKAPKDKRIERILLRLTLAEKDKLTRAAKRLKMPVATFVRSIVLEVAKDR